MGGLRKSVIAGTWYPGNPGTLRAYIEDLFAKIPGVDVDGRLIGLVSPHAGYAYSGEVAAYSYKLLRGRSFESVIIIGPSHRAFFHGSSVYDRGGFETPLGVVPVDAELAARIMSGGSRLSFIPSGHSLEHSVEIQLPFLQVVLGNFKFVPVVMGDQSRESCVELANAIVGSISGDTLIVGSSDLSHYHSDDQARKMDYRVLKHIEEMDAEGLLADLEEGTSEACGGGPIAVTMMAAARLGANEAKVLKYANSGDTTGDRSEVVGYASAAFYVKGSEGRRREGENGEKAGLSEEDKALMLRIARSAIESRLTGRKEPQLLSVSGALNEKRGAFVTLHGRGGRLRGCIGCIEGRLPLYKTVREMALAAAFNDPRFPPVSRQELDNLEIEISVLTPLREVEDISEIEVGKHGIYITRGFYSGLLLPQVATQYGWDRLEFLEETCLKAGLPPTAWKDKNTNIYIFSADVFAERDVKAK